MREGAKDVERVDKPWGYELRFVRTERYAGKILFVKAGSQLSLQYHESKDEAFFVQEGTLDLVLGRGADQRVVRLQAGQSRRITPHTVHRFRAVTDVLLFEVSTPELEDVVRLEDDYGREGTSDAPKPTPNR
jgi:mannose-6-phosphate isomerase-like protein (cupin superfamily)